MLNIESLVLLWTISKVFDTYHHWLRLLITCLNLVKLSNVATIFDTGYVTRTWICTHSAITNYNSQVSSSHSSLRLRSKGDNYLYSSSVRQCW